MTRARINSAFVVVLRISSQRHVYFNSLFTCTDNSPFSYFPVDHSHPKMVTGLQIKDISDMKRSSIIAMQPKQTTAEFVLFKKEQVHLTLFLWSLVFDNC